MMSGVRSGEFCGARLRIARLLEGFTQLKLAQVTDTSSALVSYAEAGRKQPGALIVAGFAKVLGVREGFFYLPPPHEFHDRECFFRRRTTTLVSVRHQTRAYATFFAELVARLEEHFDFPKQHLPRIHVRGDQDIERAAEVARMEYGLGRDVPVVSMMRVVETAGVPVTRFAGLSEKVDAFSRFGPQSLIVLNDKAPSRTRWDLAHELGHLLLHGADTGAAPDALEDQANRFASAFLLPRHAFMREYPRTKRFDWAALFRLKERWGASLAAIIRRAYDVSLIDPNQYRSGYKFMSWKGWLKTEPYEGTPEEPELVADALGALSEAELSVSGLAELLEWEPATFQKITGWRVHPEPEPRVSGRGKLVRLNPTIRHAV